jgi:signal transduction histidine kinase
MGAEKLKKSLTAIDESAKNAFHLMDNLLNWSRARLKRITPRKANHQLKLLVDETLRMYTTIIGHKEIDLKLSVPSDAVVFTDADMFACILRNLVSNAIKYTPFGGSISIGVDSEENHYILSISDTGIGMNANQLSAISDKFIIDPLPGLMQEKGSGLGLKLCFEFVLLTGGKIWSNSNCEKGTSISFTVPNGDKY